MTQTTDFSNFATEYPNYFPGQYLLEEDFQLQHKYLSDRLRYQKQSLHVSGIVEGLEVEEIQTDQKSVLIKVGSAIDNQGNLIVLKSDTTFDEFNNLSQGELYIEYFEDKDAQQQNEVADSYTRWKEDPEFAFAETTPETGVKLAKITISEENISEINTDIREYSGLSLPNSNGKSLTLRSGGDTNSNLAVLTGSLKLDGDLMVDGNVGIGITDPSAPLQVQATNQTAPNNNGLYIFNPTDSNEEHAILSLRVAGENGGNPFVSWDVSGESGWAMGIDNSDGYKLKIGRDWNSLANNTSMTLDTNGNVGIGMTTPGAKLEINGDLKLQNGVAVNNISSDVNLSDDNDLTIATSKAIKKYADTKALGSLSQDFSANNLTVSSLAFVPFSELSETRQMIDLWGTVYGIGIQSNTQYFRTGNNFAWYKGGSHNSDQLNSGGGTVQMVIKDGNVGIGKIDPGAKLEISGDLKLQNGVAVNNISSDVNLSDNNDLTIATSKAIKTYADTKALGSSSQDFSAKKLTVSGSLSFAVNISEMINLWSDNEGNHYGIGVQGETQYFRTYKNFAWYKGGSHNNSALNPGTGGTVQMVIKDGSVGIGTNDPGAKLEVIGGTTKLEQEAWQTAVLENSWVNYSNTFNHAGYFKDSLGIVHLKGLVKNGTGDVIFTLPDGYKPAAQELHVICTDINESGRVDIMTNGEVTRLKGSEVWLSLDGITFRAK
ncbi:MAG: hypothetical protein F6K40_34655 [Okeania sp. SIO3I5]|uniref:hypothetical protein n=1 Tax=Okeania sp. SIO3I5 TaxID=2607805 RepID=UPI0013BD8E87|nr:hypothetical protein [Okeania sp. SIO3I5]NEQ41079.1 hypothetical protein [Okeania sp. SIO3I5]